MFTSSFFAKTYFAGSYWPPVDDIPAPPDGSGVGGPLRKGRRRLEVIMEEDDWLAVVLSEM